MKIWQLGLIIAIIVEILSAIMVIICDYFADGLSCLRYGTIGFWPMAIFSALSPGTHNLLAILITTLLNTALYILLVYVGRLLIPSKR